LQVTEGGITFGSADKSLLKLNSGNTTEVNFIQRNVSGFTGTIISSSDALSFETSATERMRITSAGNVGINTTTPSSSFVLDVWANNTTYNTRIYQPSSSTSAYNSVVVSGAMTSAIAYFGVGGSAVGNTSFRDSVVIGSQTAHPLVFNTSDTERMRITSGGNVGIGTTSPSYTLDVRALGFGIQHYGNSTNILRTYAGSGFQVIEATNSGVNSQFGYEAGAFYVETAATRRIHITTGGNLGVNTSAPNGRMTIIGNTLDVRNTSGTYGTGYALEFSTNANIPRLDFVDNGGYTGKIQSVSSEFVIQNTSNNALILGTNNTERMRITSGGLVGIGTTNPTRKLTVNGEAQISAGTTDEFALAVNSASTFPFGSTNGRRSAIIAHETIGDSGLQFGWDTTDKTGIIAGSANSTGAGIDFYTFNGSAWGNKMRITKDGNVGIGTTSPSFATGGGLAVFSTSADTRIALKNTASGDTSTDGFQLVLTTALEAVIENRENASLRFLTNATEAMRITAAGNVLIGKTSGTSKFAVVGLPTSASGLASGDFYQVSGVVMVVP
jgi:hypothetical protein